MSGDDRRAGRGGAGVPGRQWTALLVTLGVVAALVHLGTLDNALTLDDHAAVERNPLTERPWDLAAHLSSGFWGEAQEARVAAWRPLTTLTLAWNRAAGGLEPAGYHAANVLLHALATILLALAAVALGASRRAALLAAALFAVHPVHVEAVAQGVGRADLLLGVLSLGAVVAWQRGRTAVALLALALAMLSKEMGVTVAFVLVWLDWTREHPGRRWMLPPVLVGLWLAARVAALGSLAGPPPGFLENPLLEADLATRVLTAGTVHLQALGLMIWPADLLYDWSYATLAPTRSLTAASVLGLALLAGFGVAIVAWRRRRPALSRALALWLLPWLLVSHLGPTLPMLLAERVLYLPSAGLLLLAGVAAGRAMGLGPAPRTAAVALVAGACLLLAGRTVARVEDWRDDETLFLADAERAPRGVKMQLNAASTLRARGEREAARGRVDRALEVGGGVSAVPHLVAAGFAVEDGDRARALRHLEAAAGFGADEAQLHVTRCAYATRFESPAQAVDACSRAAEVPFAGPRAWMYLGVALDRSGEPAEAAQAFRRAGGLERVPSVALLYNHGVFLARHGRLEEARTLLEAAASRAPGREDVQRALVGIRRLRGAGSGGR